MVLGVAHRENRCVLKERRRRGRPKASHRLSLVRGLLMRLRLRWLLHGVDEFGVAHDTTVASLIPVERLRKVMIVKMVCFFR